MDPDSSEAHSHEAETLAARLLAKGTAVCAGDLVGLYDKLPKEVSPRDPDGRIPSSFSTGAYNKGGLTGLRKAVPDFPTVTRCLVKFVEKAWPQHVYSTLGIYDNVCTSLHRDSRNASFDNLIIPLTEFGGGHLWIQDDSGTVPQVHNSSEVMGTPVPIPREGLRFNAREVMHCTMPWTGRRLILVAFTVSKTDDLKLHEMELLHDLGFPLPGTSHQEAGPASSGDEVSSEGSGLGGPIEGDPRISDASSSLNFVATLGTP